MRVYRLALLCALMGCALPKLELVDDGSGGSGSGGEQADEGCPGLALQYDQTVTHTFSIEDNPIAGDTCDLMDVGPISGFHRAIYQIEVVDPEEVNVVVTPLDGGTFVIEAYATCPPADDAGDMCNGSETPGDAVSLVGPGSLKTVIVWGDEGRYELVAYLTDP